MPPVRTPAARAGKSERTHEENVERAFIAASRRCDRTLEARVESARRASEIHKARTGRGLKITEKDVQNEEMYEEEDDDLPLQYRHLTAGFQTSSPEFNRRFAAYLTTHVAIRTALEQSIIQSYQQQEEQQQQSYLNPQNEIPQQQYEMFPSPFLAHQAQQSQRIVSPTQGSPIGRFSPYPTMPRQNLASPLSQDRRPSHTSNVIPQTRTETLNPTSLNEGSQLSQIPNPTQSIVKKTLNPASASFEAEKIQQPFSVEQGENLHNQLNFSNSVDISSLGPLSTALSAESQAFLGPNFGHLGQSSDIYSSEINDTFDSFANSNKSHFVSNEQHMKQEKRNSASGLDMTLLPEVNLQESSFIFDNPNYFDDICQSDSVDLTPESGINDESDWNCFVDRSDPWPFSE